MWDLNSGEPIHKNSDLQLECTVCAISMERDKAVMCCVKSVKQSDDEHNGRFINKILMEIVHCIQIKFYY